MIFLQENQWKDCFPWNDKRKKLYKESNCFMVPSKAEDKIIERMLSGRGPVIITESKENKVDPAEEVERMKTLQRLADGQRQAEIQREADINSSKEIALRQRLAETERDLATSLRAHTPTADESNNTLSTPATTTTESTNVDSADKGR